MAHGLWQGRLKEGQRKGLRSAAPATLIAGKLEEHPEESGFEKR